MPPKTKICIFCNELFVPDKKEEYCNECCVLREEVDKHPVEEEI